MIFDCTRTYTPKNFSRLNGRPFSSPPIAVKLGMALHPCLGSSKTRGPVRSGWTAGEGSSIVAEPSTLSPR